MRLSAANSFHHYPNPQAFFNSAYRVLRKGGRLVLERLYFLKFHGLADESSGNASGKPVRTW